MGTSPQQCCTVGTLVHPHIPGYFLQPPGESSRLATASRTLHSAATRRGEPIFKQTLPQCFEKTDLFFVAGKKINFRIIVFLQLMTKEKFFILKNSCAFGTNTFLWGLEKNKNQVVYDHINTMWKKLHMFKKSVSLTSSFHILVTNLPGSCLHAWLHVRNKSYLS